MKRVLEKLQPPSLVNKRQEPYHRVEAGRVHVEKKKKDSLRNHVPKSETHTTVSHNVWFGNSSRGISRETCLEPNSFVRCKCKTMQW